MKRLIAISVVFALVAGAAFAADVSGLVVGTVNVLESTTGKGDKVRSGGEMNKYRVEFSGGDETYGAWARLGDDGDEFNGFAWWKPLEQLELRIGKHPDGWWGKEGVTGWSFYQTASDTGVADGGGNVWSGAGLYDHGLVFRNAFYGGFGAGGLALIISPAEIVDINIGIPFIEPRAGGPVEAVDYFKVVDAQLDFKLDFGNIAITYMGQPNYYSWTTPYGQNPTDGYSATILAYAGLNVIENLGIDVGLGFQLPDKTAGGNVSNPIAVGLGLKYALDTFGVKFRTVGNFGGEKTDPTRVLVDVMPYYVVSDDVRAYVSIGLGVVLPDQGDTVMGWNFNPYVEVGSEWGPKFLAGIRVYSDGVDTGDGKIVKWSVPLALHVGF